MVTLIGDMFFGGVIVYSWHSLLSRTDLIIIILLAIAGIFVENDIAFMHYSLNHDGLHQHFFLATNHIRWDQLTDIFIQQDELGPKGSFVVCFNYGVITPINQQLNVLCHPFRYHVIRLASNNPVILKKQKEHTTALMDEKLFLALMSEVGLHVYHR